MADTPTTRGAYRKQALGDRSAAWGLSSGLNGVFDSLDEAIHGFNGVSLATVNYTLSSTNYTSNEARQRFHRFTDGGISANPTITVPATENWWLIANAVTGRDLVISNGSNSVTIDDGLTALVATDGTNVYEFPMFSTLVAPDPGSNGIVVRTALGATVARTLAGPAAGITVTSGNGVSANPTLALANDLAAVEGLASTGIAVRSASDTWVQRTVTGTAAEITVTNGDGVSGNPTLSLPASLTFTGKTITGGAFTGGTINNAVIGGSTAAAVTGTTITANTAFRGTDIGSGAANDFIITTSGGTHIRAKHRASAVNYLSVQGSATGGDVFVYTEGSDTNIDMAHVLKGAASLLTYNAAGSTLLTTLNSAGDFLPGVTESQDLGSASLEWDNLYVQNAVTVSDETFKEAIADIPYGLDFINAVRPVVYRHKSKTVTVPGIDEDGNPTTSERTITYNRLHAGLIAQEVKSAMDGLGISTNDFAGFVDASVNGGPDKLMLRYPEFIPVLIKAVQQIDARLTALEAA